MVDDSLCSLFEQVMILVIWSGQRSSSLSALYFPQKNGHGNLANC
jgi:hypothetical protein